MIRYNFKCCCRACHDGWPTQEKLVSALLSFVPLFVCGLAGLFAFLCIVFLCSIVCFFVCALLSWGSQSRIRFKISIISKSFFIVFSFEVVRLYAQLVLQRSLHQKRKCTPAPFPMGPMFPMGPNVNKCQYASGPKEIMSEMAKLSKNFTRTKIQGM